MIVPREDQARTIEELDWLLDAGRQRIVIAAPCGFGKTILAGKLIESEIQQKHKTLFVVPALELIDQTIRSFQRMGIEDIGVIQGMHEMSNWDMPVQVCSVQTLMRRTVPKDTEFVIIDECHQWFQFYGKWMLDPAWSHVPFIGLSATPWRKGLGAYFTDLIIASTTQQMIDAGLLSDFKVYAPSSPDLKGVRTIAGDYHEGELAERMNTAPLVADVVSTWLAKGENRPTLCFAVDRAHAKHLQQQFEAQGVKAAYMDAYTKDEERTLIRGRFHSGEIKVVCNVGVLTTGVDWDVRCIIMARPTKSEMLFVQIIGRGLRTAEGKNHCLLLDHSDNHLRLGFVTDIHHTQLHDGKSPLAAKAEQIALPKKCPECSYLKPPKTPVCPACGFKAEAFDKAKVVDGELIQLDRKTKQPLFELESQQNFYRELLWYGRMKGYAKGWSYHKYMERFKSEPAREWERLEPKEATMTTMKWITSRNIRWARSRFNGNARHTQQSTRPMAGDTTPPWDTPDLFER